MPPPTGGPATQMVQRKPIDLGNGLVCASLGLDGSVLSIGAPHPGLGLVELVAAPPFPAAHDGDGDAVRRHRDRLLDPTYAVLRVEGAHGEQTNDQQPEDQQPEDQQHGDQQHGDQQHGDQQHDSTCRWRVRVADWEAAVDAWAEPDRPAIVQRYRIRPPGPGMLRLRFAGRVDRPGYAEITPVGPIPPALGPSRIVSRGRVLEVSAAGTDPPVSAVVTVSAAGAGPTRWVVAGDRAWLEVSWDGAASTVQMRVRVTIGAAATVPTTDPPAMNSPTSSRRPVDRRPAGPAPVDRALDRVTAGALRYTLGCTALAVSERLCCIVTDHRLLPLSWTRDAYYQAALLLACADDDPSAIDVVHRHLAWLWGPSRDAAGVWQRSHLTTGAVKDPAYQADQQLYPLLELADFRRVTGTWPTPPGHRDNPDPGPAWGRQVRAVWAGLPRAAGGLLPGEENPADDPSGLPYLLSSQLLLGYVARRLGEWEQELGLSDLRLGDDSAQTIATTRAVFECPGPAGAQWAYESDGGTARRLYHDANDIPTALAPLWGLCGADDPWWRATMGYALSRHNPGFVPGRLGGLGSAHTPGVWPLGDAQEWATANATGDRDHARRVTDRIGLVASRDGMLPETYHPDTGHWLARHWFAWPGALLGALHKTLHHHTGPWVDP